MVKHAYIAKNFREESLRKIVVLDSIIVKYAAMNLRLTVRQLFYQFVAHHALPNNERSYQNLCKLISEARLAGLLDWNAIEDRGRVADIPREWSSVQSLVEAAIHSFRLPRWEGQSNYAELWVEKQALAGVLEPVADEHHVTLMVNKGYSSQSAMYESAQRFRTRGKNKMKFLFYLGDHDPSGEDMVRDIRERLRLFGVKNFVVKKVALTMEQVDLHKPPPNPAKLTDSRSTAYIAEHGAESWEVDALDPSTLVELITAEFDDVLDREVMEEVCKKEELQKGRLRELLAREKW